MPDHSRLSPSLARRALARMGHEESGVTLIEALVAAMVLLVGIVPTIKVFDDSRDQNATGERHQIALLQAEQALEEMRGLPYDRLLLDAGAVDPGDGRVVEAGTELRVRSDLAEPLVYATTEGVPVGDAWVEPLTPVTTGAQEAPVNMTVHRFVTWRDEECGVADLSGLGLDLPDAVNQVEAPLNSLLGGMLTSVIGVLTGSDRDELEALESRLADLRDQLAANEGALTSAVGGVSELDVCDLDSATLEDLQKLGQLTPGLGRSVTEGLTERLVALEDSLNDCLLGICVLGPDQDAAIAGVTDQINCMFGEGSGGADFQAYLSDLAAGLSGLSDTAADTAKNTKRITVAVVIDPRAGVGPSEPVWATSVVRDPAAGVLTGEGASCG